ncbi:hypothetical protein BpHYR1_015129 [Brachionus plicatilis]|uniref:Uncharacterized protein n=1 Tax=Brachionus plicatilis TaxID=10195 RepID=A0A3M7SAA7_BRAPC|nr:hypothetical protein BpHYR1_015129 [Brachionus plicatilis]
MYLKNTASEFKMLIKLIINLNLIDIRNFQIHKSDEINQQRNKYIMDNFSKSKLNYQMLHYLNALHSIQYEDYDESSSIEGNYSTCNVKIKFEFVYKSKLRILPIFEFILCTQNHTNCVN